MSGPVELFLYDDDVYTGPASVLNGTYYSGRFGWLADGFFDLPAGSGVFVENLGTSQACRVRRVQLRADSRDRQLVRHLAVGGMMTHNWYSATELAYSATYRVCG